MIKSATVYMSPRYHLLEFERWPGGPNTKVTWNVPRKYLTILDAPQSQRDVGKDKDDADAKDAETIVGDGRGGAGLLDRGNEPVGAISRPVMLGTSSEPLVTLPGGTLMRQAGQESGGGRDSTGTTAAPGISGSMVAEQLKERDGKGGQVPVPSQLEYHADPSSSARTREVSSSEESSTRPSRTRRRGSKGSTGVPDDGSGEGGGRIVTGSKISAVMHSDNDQAGTGGDGLFSGGFHPVIDGSVGDAAFGPMVASPASSAKLIYPVGTVVVVRSVDTDPGRSLKFARGETVEAGFHELLGREVR